MKKSLPLLSCNTTQKTMKNQRHKLIPNVSHSSLDKTIFTVVLTLLLTPTFGQSYYGNAYSEETITRSNSVGSNRMHYVKTGPTSGVFLLGLTSGGNPQYFSSYHISGYNINDFMIFNDTIYICGEDDHGIGFYGWTSGANTDWTFHIYRLYDNEKTFMTNVSRIRVFRSGQDLNVLLIGLYKLGGNYTYGSILHAKNNSMCTIAYANGDFFNDIAILDGYVVTIEQKGGKADGHQMRVLHKVPFSLYDTLFDTYYAWGQVQSFGRLWFQATDNNSLVSVYRDGVGYYINTFSVNSGSLVFHNYNSIATSAMPDINDVAYNSYSKTLAILHNIDTVGTASFFDCTLFPNITLSYSSCPRIYGLGWSDPQTRLFSVTRLPLSSNFVVSGICQNRSVFWNTTSQDCQTYRQFSSTPASANIDHFLWATARTTIKMDYQTYKTPLEQYEVATGCE